MRLILRSLQALLKNSIPRLFKKEVLKKKESLKAGKTVEKTQVAGKGDGRGSGVHAVSDNGNKMGEKKDGNTAKPEDIIPLDEADEENFKDF